MGDMVLEACYDGLRGAGYGTAELNPGSIYVEVDEKAYSVTVTEIGDVETEGK